MPEIQTETACPKCEAGKLIQVTEGEANLVVSEKCDKCEFTNDVRTYRESQSKGA